MSRRARYGALGASVAIVLVGALVTGVVLSRASSSPGEPSEPESATVVTPELRTFEEFPVFYLGESFEGLPLTAGLPGETAVSFIYGSCEPSGDSGCAPSPRSTDMAGVQAQSLVVRAGPRRPHAAP